MGKAFFSGWELWQKLVFVLGCGIALTVCLGSVKLAHTHWRLHKYSAVAEKERKEQAIHREMSQKRRGPGVPRADEVPFGIRALERGVEVEGVWVSRPNTPEPSIRNESRASSIWDFMPKRATVNDIERQAPEHKEQKNLPAPRRGRTVSDPSIDMKKPSSSSFDRPVSAENLSRKPAARDGNPKLVLTRPVRSKHPPPSFAKYSGNPSLHRQSATVRTFEGIEAVYRASTYLNPDASHGGNSSESYTQSSSGNSSNDSGPISAAAPRLLNQKQQSRPRHHSVDFELLNSHRQSQAAETGQLTPKTRKPTSSMDFQRYVGHGTASASSRDLGYFGIKPSTKAPLTPPSSTGSSSPPKIDTLPATVRRSSMPDVTPFMQFVQTAPATPSQTGRKLSVIEVMKEPAVQSGILTPPSREKLITSASPARTKAGTPDQTTAGAVRPSFEKERRPSQVIRGHGSGFEILKPGSLPAMTPAVSPPPEKQYAVPPVSLKNYGRSRSRSSSRGSTGRKLQKKKRASSIDF